MTYCRILLLWLILGCLLPISSASAYFSPTLRDKARTLYKEGLVLKREGHLQEARRCFAAAIARQQDFYEAHLELGHVYLLLEQPAAAREHYQQVLRQPVPLPEVFHGLATASYALGDYAAVPGYCERATPAGSPALWLLAGKSYFHLGQYDAAVAVLTLAVARSAIPVSEVYLYLGMSSLQLGDTVGGIAELRKACAIQPCDTAILFQLAHACYQQADYAAAVGYWQELLAIVPEHAFAAYMLGKSYIGMGHTALGQSWCERALQ